MVDSFSSATVIQDSGSMIAPTLKIVLGWTCRGSSSVFSSVLTQSVYSNHQKPLIVCNNASLELSTEPLCEPNRFLTVQGIYLN